jgi:hypothetical protein
MTTKELALTICEMFQRDYNNRPIWQTMLEIEDLINKQRPKQFFIADVSQQRELLYAFVNTMEFDIKHETYEEDIEYFLKENSSI